MEGSKFISPVVNWCGIQDDRKKALNESHHSGKLVEDAVCLRARRGIQMCSDIYATCYSVILESDAAILEDASPWTG